MRVAIISEYNQLTTTGGTEYYTGMLAEVLASHGIDVLFIGLGQHTNGIVEHPVSTGKGTYKMCLLPTRHYIREEIQQYVISSSWDDISAKLQLFAPDIIHVHTLTTFFNIRHLESCAKNFKRIIFTSHVPEHFCIKGDMIRQNAKPCHGKINAECTLCLFSVSVKKGISALIKGHVSSLRHNLKSLFSMGVRVVCTSEWQKNQLLENGFPENRINVIRQALNTDQTTVQSVQSPLNGKIRIGYLGRLTTSKGAQLLYNLISHYSHSDKVEFVLGIPANSDTSWNIRLQELLLKCGVKVRVMTHISSINKDDFFSEIDILFIPSFGFETGPIVLLEALLYEKKVLAPDVGGTSEFAKQYAFGVTTYSWQNIDAVIEKVEGMLHSKIQYSNIDTHPFLHNRNQFFDQHLQLYEQSLADDLTPFAV